MLYEIEDKDLLILLETGNKGKYKSFARDRRFMEGLRRVFATFETALDVDELLNKWSFLHYERLTGDRSGFSSCRITNSSPMRLIIRERDDKLFITIIKLEDYH